MKISISLEDMQRFYQDKNINGKCPVCGHDSWAFVDQPQNGAAWALVGCDSEGLPTTPFSTIPLAVLGCRNCHGFRMHSAIQILAWLDEEKKKNGTA